MRRMCFVRSTMTLDCRMASSSLEVSPYLAMDTNGTIAEASGS